MGEICGFGVAWIGKCKEPTTKNGRCDEHADLKCCSCGEPATHECPETMTFVCGFYLCDNCEHTIHENGCNSGAALPEGLDWHCKKTEQVYLPWYRRDKKDNKND